MSLKCHVMRSGSILIGCFGLALATSTAAAGDKIQVYRVPKEPSPLLAQGNLPAGHPELGDDHTGHNHGTPAAPKVTYTTPEGWREAGAGEMRVVGFTIPGTNGQTAQVAVTPLAGMAGKESLIVNMWRQQVGLGELSEDEAAKQLTAVDIGGDPGKMFDMTGKSSAGAAIRIVTAMAHRGSTSWFYKLQGDDELVTAQKPNFIVFLKSVKIEEVATPVAPAALPDGHPPIGETLPTTPTASTAAPREGGPTWTAPAGWKEISGGQFLFAKFLIAGEGAAKAAVNVSTSAGDGGGLLANVNRWRGQLGLGSWSEAELQKSTQEIEVAGGKGTYVELSGTDSSTDKPATTLGVKVARQGSTWYYKLMGDPKLVAAQKENFREFVKGVKY